MEGVIVVVIVVPMVVSKVATADMSQPTAHHLFKSPTQVVDGV